MGYIFGGSKDQIKLVRVCEESLFGAAADPTNTSVRGNTFATDFAFQFGLAPMEATIDSYHQSARLQSLASRRALRPACPGRKLR
jgi:hypothetical protein